MKETDTVQYSGVPATDTDGIDRYRWERQILCSTVEYLVQIQMGETDTVQYSGVPGTDTDGRDRYCTAQGVAGTDTDGRDRHCTV
jgi:hypothetical protein